MPSATSVLDWAILDDMIVDFADIKISIDLICGVNRGLNLNCDVNRGLSL